MKIEKTITKWITRDRGDTNAYMLSEQEPYYTKKYGVWAVRGGHYEYAEESDIPIELQFAEGGPSAIRKLEYRLVETKSEETP